MNFKKANRLFIFGLVCLSLINTAYSQSNQPSSADKKGAPAKNEKKEIQDNFLELRWTNVATRMLDEWYGSEQAKAVAEEVLKYQTEIGGWAKNTGYHNNSVKQDEWERIKRTGVGATFDNDSTLTEMVFLTKVYAKIKDERYREAFMKGFNYVLKAQYPNGGFPQYYPYRKNKSSYSSHITYNDDVMVRILKFLDDIVHENPLYAPMKISEEMRLNAKLAFDKGVECILKTQIVVNGLPTVWCAQHDEVTLKPVGARSYELPSFSGEESAGVVLLLMDIENPSPAIINAVNGAVKWFEDHKIEGIRIKDIVTDGQKDRVVVQDKSAPLLWARFYDLETGKPFFSDRDGVKKSSLAELGINRRGGYNWYTEAPQKVLERYSAWSKKHGVRSGQVIPIRKKTPEASNAGKITNVAPVSNAPAGELAKMEAEVGLTDEQKSKVAALLTEMNAKRRAVRDDASFSKEEQIIKIKAVNEEVLGKIRALMTPEQYMKWEKFQQARRDARKPE